MVAHVIRAVPGQTAVSQRHHHEVEFQMVYVLKDGSSSTTKAWGR